MAGPNYDVGITFLAKGDLSKVLATLNAQMKELAANAIVVSTAMSNAVISGAKKESLVIAKASKAKKDAAAQALAATKLQEKEKKVAAAQALAATELQEKTTKSAAAQALAATKLQEKTTKSAAAQALAATRAQEAANTKASGVKEIQIKREEMMLRKKNFAAKEADIATKRRISSIGHALKAGGMYGGGKIGSVLGMAMDPITFGLAAVTAALVASTYGANQYANALLKIETSGVGAAQAQKELAQALGARSGMMGAMAPTTAGAMLGYLNSIFPRTNVEGSGKLMSTAAEATEFLRSNYGQSQVDASGQVMHLVESIKRGLSASGVSEAGAYKQTPAILSAVMSNITTMGPHAQQYLDTVNTVLGDKLATAALGSANMPAYFSNIRGLVAGGMSSENIDAMARAAGVGGMDKNTVLAMMSEGMRVNVGDLSSVIAGRKFGIGDPVAAKLALTDPSKYAGDYLYKGATGVTLDAAQKLDESQRAAMNKKALGAYKQGSWAYDAVSAAVTNYGFNEKKPDAGWSAMVNPLTTSMDLLRKSTDNLAIAMGSSVGVSAATWAAKKVESLADFISAPSLGGAAGLVAPLFTFSPVRSIVSNAESFFGGSPQNAPPSGSSTVGSVTIIAHGKVDVKGHGSPGVNPSSVFNKTHADGAYIPRAFTNNQP